MLYRKFGSCDFEVSALGFGCMRFPILNGDSGQIDEAEAIRMLRYAIDNGVNYVDTAYPYHKKNSELIVGKALKDGYREKVRLATKLPAWLTNTYEDFDKYLNEQLEKLQTNCIDFYLLHSLSKDTWKKIKDLKVLDFLDSALKDGRIKHAGFSFHDDINTFKEIVDSYDWTFCQIQYNYMDEKYQAGAEGLKYAASKGLAVVVMEPLRGGKLVQTPPDEVQEIFNTSPVNRTPAEWGLSWIWNQPEVSIVLSGMSTMEQVEQNIETAGKTGINSLSDKDISIIDRVKAKYNQLTKVKCTACEYCLPCPAGVAIPSNFSLYNDASMYKDTEKYINRYNNEMPEKARASSCVECGKCEAACPQHLPIRKYLKEVHSTLSR
jgi:predicted aldo/keto reductase-like oxidoreductase